MFRALLWLAVTLVTCFPARAAEPDYLSDASLFAEAWGTLTEQMGAKTDVAEILIRPEEIVVLARAGQGGARVDQWRVGRTKFLLWDRDSVSGPQAVRDTGPVANVESGFFPLTEVPLDRLFAILREAQARVKLDDPGRITMVRIARQVSILPQPSYGDVRWTLDVGSERETASVTTDASGKVMGVDISGTNRGRNKNFFEQDEWPLADAQASFRSIVGTKPEVYAIDVSATTITMQAVTAGSPKSLTAWFWDGGTFRKDFIETPNMALVMNNGDLPFSLDDIDVAKLPLILKAARAAEPSGHPRIMLVKITKERVAVGDPTALWEVQLVDGRRQIPLFGEDFSERTRVKLKPDGTVVSVLLPQSVRPKTDYSTPDGILTALSAFRTSYGKDLKILEVNFDEKRAEISLEVPDQPGMQKDVSLTDKGLEASQPFPSMPLDGPGTFPLAVLDALDKAAIERLQKAAIEAIAMPGAKLHRTRIWNGAPFWRSRDGKPLLDVRVGIPPRYDLGGYVVFSLDGKLVETVK